MRSSARFVRFSAAYNGFVEGVLTMPSYEIVIDTTNLWDAFPGLRAGVQADPAWTRAATSRSGPRPAGS